MTEEKSVVVEVKKHWIVFGSDTSILVFCMAALMSLYFIPMSIKFSVRSSSEAKICEAIVLKEASSESRFAEIFKSCLKEFDK